MKNISKALVLVIALVMVFTPVTADFTKAQGTDGNQAVSVSVGLATADAATSYHLSAKTKQLYVGGTYTLKLLTGSGKTVKASSVKWSSDTTSVATIDAAGKITAKAKGEALIRAEYNDEIYSLKLTVIKKVTVKTATALVKALGSYTEISLEAETFNLTKYLKKVKKSVEPEGLREEFYDAYYVKKNVYASPVFDGGYELIVTGLKDLTIKSKSSKNQATIVCEPRYANVMLFDHCENVTVQNVIMGHTIEPGYCVGSVLYFNHCTNSNVKKCNLYGCGTYGVAAYESDGLKVDNCYIHDCSYGGVDIIGGTNIVIEDTRFERTGEFACISVNSEAFVDVMNCKFYELQIPFQAGLSSYIYAGDCEFCNDAWANIPAQGPDENIHVVYSVG